MKKFTFLLCGVMLLAMTGCNKNQEPEENKVVEPEQKLLLELPHHIDIQEENEKTISRKTEIVNITDLKLENIEKSCLKDYASKLQSIINFIKNKYPNFDVNKWNIMCNMYSEDGSGILKMNYIINNKIETNKSIFFTIENNNVVLVSFINMDLNADKNKVYEEIEKFESMYEQQKKEFSSNEEFISEETYYTYFYNLDKLVYTYQLFFYENIDSEKIINNSYVSVYVVNEKGALLKI